MLYSTKHTNMTNNNKVKCAICEIEIDEETSMLGDEGSEYDGQPICEDCYSDDESQLSISVLTGDEPRHWEGIGQGDGKGEIYEVGRCFNHTRGDFTAKWHSTDPWRGYYEAIAHGFTKIWDDCILAWSEDAGQLEKFDAELIARAKAKNATLLRVIGRTSNCFSSGYDLYTPDAQADLLNQDIEELSAKYRDDYKFRRTALYGE